MNVVFLPLQAIVWDEYLTGPFGLIAQYSLLKVSAPSAQLLFHKVAADKVSDLIVCDITKHMYISGT